MTCQNHLSLSRAALRATGRPVPVQVYFQGAAEEAPAQVLAAILRTANTVAGGELYEVNLHYGIQPVAGNNGATVVFLGSQEDRWSLSREDSKALRTVLLGAGRIILVGSAVFLPVEAGLGECGSLAIHSNFLAPMAEEHPDHPVASGPVAQSGRFASAVSQFAAQKLLISAIAQDHGEITAKAVSQYVGLEDRSSSTVPSEIWKYVKKSSGDRLVCEVLKTMNKHIEEPLPISEIARIAGTSVRQVQRQFKSKTQASPQHIYREIRLNYAHNLVTRSNLPVIDVALAAGFQNYGTFHENFKRQFGASPAHMRKTSFFGVR